jgi:short-subunit dehydrogenase
MKKRILITGAGSGFGEGTAIGLAQKGHDVIASAHIWPQVTRLRQKAESLGLNNLTVEKLDILDPLDICNAMKWDIDILVNNAAISFTGPLAEVPLELMWRVFETNVFETLRLTQKFVRKFVEEKRAGKIVFISSIAGLGSTIGLGPYCASKHALQSIAETLQKELKDYNIKIQTINPGAFKTGFNDTMAETAFYWMNDEKNFNKKADVKKQLEKVFEEQGNPQDMIDEMIKIIPADSGKFRNVFPKKEEDNIKKSQAKAWEDTI